MPFATNANLNRVLSQWAAKETGPLFLDKPDRWYEGRKWRCLNDHVSDISKGASSGGHRVGEVGAICQVCGEPLLLTFPEDADGPLGPPPSPTAAAIAAWLREMAKTFRDAAHAKMAMLPETAMLPRHGELDRQEWAKFIQTNISSADLLETLAYQVEQREWPR